MLAQLEWAAPDPEPGARRRWLRTGWRPEPHPARIGLYEPAEPTRDDVGICCSGGGIRSAAFNLGALQVLQERRILQDSKYVSAVSGGSYMAAAFSMVAKTSRPGDKASEENDSDPGLVTEAAPPFHPGSPEEQYLRNHLGYLAPTDFARIQLALRMLAGLLVNVLFVGLPLFIVGLLVGLAAFKGYGGMSIERAACPQGDDTCDYESVVAAAAWVAIGAVGALGGALAVTGVLWRTRKDLWRVALETWQVRLVVLAFAGLVFLVVVPWIAARAMSYGGGQPSPGEAGARPALAAVSSLAALFAATLGYLRGALRDERAAAAGVARALGRFVSRARQALIATVVMLGGPLLLLMICVLGTLIAVTTLRAEPDASMVGLGPFGEVSSFVAWLVGSVALLGALWTVIDLTTLSLHPFYRRRLCSAFALKRVWVRSDGEVVPAPPDGSGDGRAEARERSYDALVELSKSGVEPGSTGWPMLIVCAAANVSDPGATPPGRSVASFTFSPTAIGGPLTGAARTLRYEQDLPRNRRRDVTLPAAVAMSGAAISPSMGKATYRPMRFLLALANIRLGVWVPNPTYVNRADEATDRNRVSIKYRPRPTHLWREMLGRNRLAGRFLYVSDGGHYDNLGLVELLRRGCRTIYCVDAGGGRTSGALADAIALARTELNVDIAMESEALELAEDVATHRAPRACVRGRVTFPPTRDGDPAVEGTLYYVRSLVPNDAPWQVIAYQESHPVFPHHSTLDQFFDDERFEAYRALGEHVARAAVALERLHAPPPKPPTPSTPAPATDDAATTTAPAPTADPVAGR
jgi:hypothetical protein